MTDNLSTVDDAEIIESSTEIKIILKKENTLFTNVSVVVHCICMKLDNATLIAKQVMFHRIPGFKKSSWEDVRGQVGVALHGLLNNVISIV